MPKLVSGIKDVPNRMRAVAEELIRRAADTHVEVSKQLSPVDTGFMKASITKLPGDNDLSRRVIVGADYGLYVEFGTVKAPAQPFFIPGYESASSQLKTEAAALIGKELSKVVRKAA